MHSLVKGLASGIAALAITVTPTMASAQSTTSSQPINPLVVVSVYGSKASAEIAYPQAAANAASVAALAQADDSAYGAERDRTIIWLLVALDLIIAGAGIYTLFDDDDDDDEGTVSPT